MNVKTFIDRPITSVMISVVIVIIGIISLIWLPLEQYPDITPPTVKVSQRCRDARYCNCTCHHRSMAVSARLAFNAHPCHSHYSVSHRNVFFHVSHGLYAEHFYAFCPRACDRNSGGQLYHHRRSCADKAVDRWDDTATQDMNEALSV